MTSLTPDDGDSESQLSDDGILDNPIVNLIYSKKATEISIFSLPHGMK